MERILSAVTLQLYRSDQADWTAPTIYCVRIDAGVVEVSASDDSGLHELLVTYTTGDGVWRTSTLTLAENGIWRGTMAAGSGSQAFIQAVDSAGNVAVATNGGQYFTEHAGCTLFLPTVRGQ